MKMGLKASQATKSKMVYSFIIQSLSVVLVSTYKYDNYLVFLISIGTVVLTAVIYSQLNTKMFISLFLVGLTLLDYDAYFVFGDLRLRLWYFAVIILLPYIAYARGVWRLGILQLMVMVYLSVLALVCGGFLDFGKYLLYIAALFVLVGMHRKGWYSLVGIFPILMIPIYYSVSQFFLYFLFSFDSYLWSSPRASAYFSESTWLGAYCVLMVFYLYHLYKNKLVHVAKIYIHGVLTLCILFLSASINALLGVSIFSIFLVLTHKKGRLFVLIFIFIFMVLGWFVLAERFSNLGSDLSFLGRLVGFETLFESLKGANILGSGFLFNYDTQFTDSGAALGAKAFSFPFQLYAIGGLPLFVVYLYFIAIAIYADIHSKRTIGAVILISFFILSCFAPLAQGIVGIYFIWLRMCIKEDDQLEALWN